MMKLRIGIVSVFWWVSFSALSWAQTYQPVEMILHNGKILTVDDDGFTSQLGTIAQAMHVRDGKVLHMGNNAEIRAMAGPNTKVIDLKGRTVIPGMMSTHEHPMDWDLLVPEILGKVFPNNEVIFRVFEGGQEQTIQEFYPKLEEAVRSARPGQWIYLIVTSGRRYEHSVGGNSTLGLLGRYPTVVDGKRITKQTLDVAAPNNPVIVRDIFVATLLNQRAIDILKTLPFYQHRVQDNGGQPIVSEQTGLGASHRWAVPDLLFKDYYPQLREAYRLGLEWWASYGITTIGSACYNPRCTVTYGDLDRRNQMPIRMMWAWNWRQQYFYQDDYFLAAIVGMLNKGSDYFWNGGGLPGPDGRDPGCSGSSLPIIDTQLRDQMIAERSAPPQLGASALGVPTTGLNCEPDPNSPAFRYIKAGGRQATRHHSYDKDVDNTMDLVEKASRAAGFTLEEMQAKRHAFDHNGLHPRPDQVPRLKQLGMMAGGNAFEIWDTSSEVMKYFGERAVAWVVPKKTLSEGGVYSSFEVDRALGTTDLTVFECCVAPMITRKAWDGKVYAPSEAISRELALKTSTIWPARYVLREDVLGSLEPGKWADFMVLDRDYLRIPQDEIAKVRVLMTVVGGRVIHLAPSLARELGMQPAGSQVTLGGPSAQW